MPHCVHCHMAWFLPSRVLASLNLDTKVFAGHILQLASLPIAARLELCACHQVFLQCIRMLQMECCKVFVQPVPNQKAACRYQQSIAADAIALEANFGASHLMHKQQCWVVASSSPFINFNS